MKSASQLRRFNPALVVATLAAGWITVAPGEEARVVVAAGDFDRAQTIVDFTPPKSKQTDWQLRDGQGRLIPVQIDLDGRASFVLSKLTKHQTAMFELLAGAPPIPESGGGVEIRRDGKKLKITSGGKPVLDYQMQPGELPRPDIKPILARGGYIHPVFSPSGRAVTDDYPSNHAHHHGIWFPWTKTEFEGRTPDFWNMGQGSGRVEYAGSLTYWTGPVFGAFRTRHRFVDMTATEEKTALTEEWEVRVYALPAGAGRRFWMFDLISTQECASASPLKLPQYYYGGLGFRGHWDWNGKGKAFFLTSEGETNRVTGNETRARWVHLSGDLGGELSGVAILGHPDNFRAPQPLRLHPTEPFICFAPSQLGDWEIVPGQPYVSRYRFVVADGPPDRAELDRLWHDYAHPPEVRVEVKSR
ncbi:MAG: PmoA family protein [Verrucomicrobiae bacterium]|nr:PmoA family protein [Verrucomicrobiae bacterium]